jgi:hypothetical protein
MNRRMALLLGLLSGGLLGRRALGQDRGRLDDFDDPPARRRTTRTAGRGDDDAFGIGDEPDPRGGPVGSEPDVPPANFRDEAGHAWRSFDIARYTSQAYTAENPKPQNALVEWIFRGTGSAAWHGEKIAVLSAGRAQLRAYHNPRMLRVVQEYVERFTRATADVISVRVRFVAAQDTRWRYAVYGRLNRIGTGPQGQQIWTVPPDDANLVRTQMMLYQGFKLLADKTVRMHNGQTMTMETSDVLDYVAGTQSDGNASLGPQPRADQLKEGVTLRLSPLLTYDGDALDAAIELKATTIKRLIRTKILARREVGPADMAIDVPEVIETRLNRTVSWELGRTLIISAGITPGILQSKTGFLNLRVPGTVPTDTELLVFIDVDPDRQSMRGGRRRERPAEDDIEAEEPAFRARPTEERAARRRDGDID